VSGERLDVDRRVILERADIDRKFSPPSAAIILLGCRKANKNFCRALWLIKSPADPFSIQDPREHWSC